MMLRRWHKKRIMYVCVLGVFLYLILRTKQHNVVHEGVIRNVKPADVWEFVADFSNMKHLNPTILDFKILAESGNFDDWKYTVEYTEFLSSFPFIHNFLVSHINVKPDKQGAFLIQAHHSSCFYTRLACLSSESQFRFEPNGTGTKCIEKVSFECPLAFSWLCHREVMFQRKAIISNLQKMLST